MTTLLLFDIDGTLVLTGGAGARAMSRAFEDVFGIADGAGAIPMAGRTDAWIVAQMAARHGVACDSILLRRFHDCYVQHLACEVLADGPRKGVLPGIRPLLDMLASRDDAHLALLTGNFRRGAQIKLEHFGLWHYFAGGAYGDASHDRTQLLWDAIHAVQAAGGPSYGPSDVVIIGDTPHDVAVAAAGGARCIAVATGGFDARALRESGADLVFEDLSDHAEVVAALRLSGA